MARQIEHSRLRQLSMFLLVLLLVMAALVLVIIPHLDYQARQDKFRSTSLVVSANIKSLIKETEALSLNNTESGGDKKIIQLNTSESHLNQLILELDFLNQDAKELESKPWYGFFGFYDNSKLLVKRTGQFTGQTREVVIEQLKIINYLRFTTSIEQSYRGLFKSMSAVRDLSTLIDRSSDFKLQANYLLETKKSLSKITPPVLFEDYQKELSDLTDRVAATYLKLSFSVKTKNQFLIAKDVDIFDTLSISLETSVSSMKTEAMEKSPAFINLYQLNSKLNLLDES